MVAAVGDGGDHRLGLDVVLAGKVAPEHHGAPPVEKGLDDLVGDREGRDVEGVVGVTPRGCIEDPCGWFCPLGLYSLCLGPSDDADPFGRDDQAGCGEAIDRGLPGDGHEVVLQHALGGAERLVAVTMTEEYVGRGGAVDEGGVGRRPVRIEGSADARGDRALHDRHVVQGRELVEQRGRAGHDAPRDAGLIDPWRPHADVDADLARVGDGDAWGVRLNGDARPPAGVGVADQRRRDDQQDGCADDRGDERCDGIDPEQDDDDRDRGGLGERPHPEAHRRPARSDVRLPGEVRCQRSPGAGR